MTSQGVVLRDSTFHLMLIIIMEVISVISVITDGSMLKEKCSSGETLQQLLLKLNYDTKLVKVYRIPMVLLWAGFKYLLRQLPELPLNHKVVDNSSSHVIFITRSHDYSSSKNSYLLSPQSKTDNCLLEKQSHNNVIQPDYNTQQRQLAELSNKDNKKILLKSDVIIIDDEGEDDDVINNHQVKISCGVTLSVDDISTMNPGQWLNDQVINGYMRLLMYYYKDVYITNTFFYTKLKKFGFTGIIKWIHKVHIFEYSKFLIPIHIMNNHWTLVVIDICHKRIEYYDSLGVTGNNIVKRMQYLIMKIARYEKRLEKWNRWRRSQPKNIPRQCNNSDCGVFICQYAKWICQRRNPSSLIPSFSSVKMRHLMITELKNELLITLDKHYN